MRRRKKHLEHPADGPRVEVRARHVNGMRRMYRHLDAVAIVVARLRLGKVGEDVQIVIKPFMRCVVSDVDVITGFAPLASGTIGVQTFSDYTVVRSSGARPVGETLSHSAHAFNARIVRGGCIAVARPSAGNVDKSCVPCVIIFMNVGWIQQGREVLDHHRMMMKMANMSTIRHRPIVSLLTKDKETYLVRGHSFRMSLRVRVKHLHVPKVPDDFEVRARGRHVVPSGTRQVGASCITSVGFAVRQQGHCMWEQPSTGDP